MADQVEVQQRIAGNIRVWAKIRRVTLKSLQAELGMKKGPFFERLRGQTSMSITELEDIAKLLDVGIADLVATDGWAARGSNPEPADGGLVLPEGNRIKPGQSVTIPSVSSAEAA